MSEAHLRRVLIRFESFHRAWEPRIETLIDWSAFLVPRRRLALLQADLAALGAAPECGPGPDLSWLVGAPAAWGSLYVLEGSTLGGQIITKALSTQAWRPAAGVTYFHGRGRQTGAFWRETTVAIEAQGLAGGRDPIIAAAVRTFESLTDWLVPPSGADP
jgi:heme oxygenase